MNRPLLVTTMLMGGLITGVSSTGILADANDSALTGTVFPERVTAPEFDGVVPDVDIQIAGFTPIDAGAGGCSTFVEDATYPAFDTDLPIVASQELFRVERSFCVHNAGNRAADLQFGVVNLSVDQGTCAEGELPYGIFGDDGCDPNLPLNLSLAATVKVALELDEAATADIGQDPSTCPEFENNNPSLFGLFNDPSAALTAGVPLEIDAVCVYTIAVHGFANTWDQTDTVHWQFRFLAGIG